MLTYVIVYLTIGAVLGLFARLDDDRIALLAGLEYTALFLFLWPIPLLYMTHMFMKHGTLKYKGKVIWQAKKGKEYN